MTSPAIKLIRGSDDALSSGARRCRRKFLRVFPRGFYDETYLEWERNYKVSAHREWHALLAQPAYRALLRRGAFAEIAARACRIESRTNLLFSFEKMALRDAVRSPAGARLFAEGLFRFLYGGDDDAKRFAAWCATLAALPRRQTRVVTWPLATVFGFLALPRRHFFLKPRVTQRAAEAYGFDMRYRSRPSWDIYAGVLAFAARVRRDLDDLRPRDMIDIQSFLWVQGSDEYA